MQPSTQHSLDLNAVIYISVSSVAMLITTNADGAEVDFLEQSIPLGHDIFSKDKISKSTTERAVKIIQGYIDNVSEYGPLQQEQIYIYTTNILEDAVNKAHFINRIQIACNIPVAILDDGEMTRLLYLKTQRRLKDTPAMKNRNALVVHVGPGNTRIILFNEGRIVSYNSYRMGTHRTVEAIDSLELSGKALIRVIREHTGGQIASIINKYSKVKIEDVILIGSEIQTFAMQLTGKKADILEVKKLKQLGSTISNLSIDEIVREYPFDYQSAEAVLPAIEMNLAIIEALNTKNAHLPDSDYERGLLSDLTNFKNHPDGFEDEVMLSALQLSEKFEVNIDHAQQVTALCEQLFHSLTDIHLLDSYDLLLLRAAAILHEAGGFIQSKAHHKHSMYLIMHSEIFGMSQSDVNIIALISRYHRNSQPKPQHQIYKDLSVSDQIRVTKLSALLRVADALDRAHTSRIRNIHIEVQKRKLILNIRDVQDASVERLAMRNKGGLFQDIFGMEIIINEQLS